MPVKKRARRKAEPIEDDILFEDTIEPMGAHYEIVTSTDIAGLERKVNDKIKEGYRPLGGVAKTSEFIPYAQAMLKPK
jgi:hypothetical protein